MGRLLAHRGPDGAGTVRMSTGVIGHRRLSIIDLSEAASQPLWDAGRRAVITFNGEIYNYRELREECLRAGAEFLSTSDTEVVIHLYLLQGERAFDRLNGIFAFCLHDERSGDDFLVRDPSGVKPLYYADTPAGLFFASELGPLVRTGVVSREIDPAGLEAYLQLDYVPAPRSILKDVRKLREGHLLHVDRAGRKTARRYSTLDDPAAPRRASLEEDVNEFGRLVRQAVERQLVADVPVGILLSGGVDSAIVAAAAAESAPKRIQTFSIAFEDPSFDESKYQREVAERIGSDHHTEILRPEAMLELLPHISQVVSEPLADGSIFPTHLLAKFTRRSVKVALSGDGADELFAGYPTYGAARAARWLTPLPSSMRRSLARAADAVLPVCYDNFSFDFKVKKFLAGLDSDPIARNMRWLGSFAPEELSRILVRYEASEEASFSDWIHEPSASIPDATPLEKLLRTDQRFYMQDNCLVKVDRASMAASLEVRVPFLDPDLVRFARSLPDDRKLGPGGGKRILKLHAAGRLPESVVGRRKKGFGAPLGKWFRGELRELLGDTLSPARIRSQGLLRESEVARLLAEHWSGRRDHRKRLFNVLSLTLWFESFAAAKPEGAQSPAAESMVLPNG